MSTSIALIGAVGLVLVVLGIPPLRRIRMAARVEPFLGGLRGRPALLRPYRRDGFGERLGRRVDRLVRRAGRDTTAQLEARLDAAGVYSGLDRFRLEQLVWGAVASMGTVTVGALASIEGAAAEPLMLPASGLISFAAGFAARDRWLTHEVEARRRRIREQIPIAADLITLSVTAGEAPPAACRRTAEVLRGELGRELERVTADVRAGQPFVDSLEAMSGRLSEPALARLVDALCLAIERGSPLAETLRGQADDAREASRRRILELGGRREVVMLVPVVFLIMPVIVVFALLPGLVSLELLVP